MTNSIPENKILIQFDGMCVLCSRTVRLIMKADKHRKFVFRSFQSNAASEIFQTVELIKGESVFRYFDAVILLGNELGGFYRLINIFRIIPRNWRNKFYLWIARNRFKWFGKRTSCYLPTGEDRTRFV